MWGIKDAIIALMTSITTTCGALNKVAKSIDNLATVAEETSGAYVDEARADRASKAAARLTQP